VLGVRWFVFNGCHLFSLLSVVNLLSTLLLVREDIGLLIFYCPPWCSPAVVLPYINSWVVGVVVGLFLLEVV
jgi:hypothetical protein